MARTSKAVDRETFIAEFNHTRSRHDGSVTFSAPLFGVTPKAMARRLYRARAAGFPVLFHDDTHSLRRSA